MPSRTPQLGSVVWVEVADPNGHRKVRPAVIVTPTADIMPTKPVHLVAITTRLPDSLPDEYVLLPWDPQGNARTGLRRKCAAVASWQAVASVENVQSVVGLLPPATIRELLAKVAAQLGRE